MDGAEDGSGAPAAGHRPLSQSRRQGAHGAQEGNRYTHGQIVDTYLTVFEGLMTVGSREGFKP